jgi:hypothetical protein
VKRTRRPAARTRKPAERTRRIVRGALGLAATLAVAACSITPSPPSTRDLDGHAHTPTVVPAGHVHVLAFVSPECPIANACAPSFAALARQWPATVRVYVVVVDPAVDAAAARRHRDDYELPGTVLLDPHHHLARSLGITMTPEFAVLTPGTLAYRGRLDDQWRALGSRAPTATQHDLRDAVAAAIGGRPVPTPWPEAVGCLLPEPAVE